MSYISKRGNNSYQSIPDMKFGVDEGLEECTRVVVWGGEMVAG